MLPGKTAYATIKSPIDSSNFSNTIHHIGSVMVSVLTSCVVDVGFEPGRVKPKTIKLVFVASSLNMRRKSKDWLARNQNNVSEWSDMSTRGLLFQ